MASPAAATTTRVAVIGAGISGLTAARALSEHGLCVTVFEKARGPSGRMSTRRAQAADGTALQFDHGAQFFTARDPEFESLAKRWATDGVVSPWNARFGTVGADGGNFQLDAPRSEPRWVGTPRMSSVGRTLSKGLSLQTSVRVVRVDRLAESSQWSLHDDSGEVGVFDRVIVAVPPEQAVPLLAQAPALAKHAASCEMVPCQALMAVFDSPIEVGFDAARVQSGPLAWVARNSSKPDRPADKDMWVAHVRPDSAAEWVDTPKDQLVGPLVAALQSVLKTDQKPTWTVAHSWRYARPALDRVDGPRCLFDSELGIGACGDWLVGARVEAAWQSGSAAAARLLETL